MLTVFRGFALSRRLVGLDEYPGFRIGGGDVDRGLDLHIEVTSISLSNSSKESQSPESWKELQLCVLGQMVEVLFFFDFLHLLKVPLTDLEILLTGFFNGLSDQFIEEYVSSISASLKSPEISSGFQSLGH